MPAVTKPKGFGPDDAVMNDIDTAREARSRSLARLRKLTIGTAAVGVAATTGFGWLAAATYSGATTAATAYATTSNVASTASSTSGTTSIATSSSTSSGSTVATATAAPAVTAVSGAANVTSGGS